MKKSVAWRTFSEHIWREREREREGGREGEREGEGGREGGREGEREGGREGGREEGGSTNQGIFQQLSNPPGWLHLETHHNLVWAAVHRGTDLI